MPGTDRAYAVSCHVLYLPTRVQRNVRYWPAYAATRCPVLTSRMVLQKVAPLSARGARSPH
eukprot:3702783-Rhodomonas_salina.2